MISLLKMSEVRAPKRSGNADLEARLRRLERNARVASAERTTMFGVMESMMTSEQRATALKSVASGEAYRAGQELRKEVREKSSLAIEAWKKQKALALEGKALEGKQ